MARPLNIGPRLVHPLKLRIVVKPAQSWDFRCGPFLGVRDRRTERGEANIRSPVEQPFRQFQRERPNTAFGITGQENAQSFDGHAATAEPQVESVLQAVALGYR